MVEWIVNYEVVEGSGPSQLAEGVMSRIAGGWQPFGSPYAVGGVHCQAVVRTQEGLARFENERRRQGEAVETG